MTIVVAIVVVIGVAAAVGRKARHEGLEVESINKKYQALADDAAPGRRSKRRTEERTAKSRRNATRRRPRPTAARPRSFVIDFKGDLKASAVPSLREEVSAILDVATADDEVIVRLENHGGVVHEHGLAASQLARIRDRDIPLIVCVDKVAASGGYLMACVASKIYAAPFAILGSIGVLAQIPNFNRLLDSHGVDFEQVTAGKYKRTVTMFGQNTDEDRAKLKEELEDVHKLFKAAVSRYRPDSRSRQGRYRRALVRHERAGAGARGRDQDQRRSARRPDRRARPVPGQLSRQATAAEAADGEYRQRAGKGRCWRLAATLRVTPAALRCGTAGIPAVEVV